MSAIVPLPEKSAAAGAPAAPSPRFGEGSLCEGDDPRMLAAAIEAAFDYRGDVTLTLSSGESVVGYLSNRDARAAEPFVEVFPADGTPRRRIPCSSIRAVAFTGRDTASGKSWETWVKAYQAKKAAGAPPAQG